MGGSKRRRIVPEDDGEDEDEDDEVLRALDEFVGDATTPQAASDAGKPDDHPMSDADDDDAPGEAKWTVGALLRSVGVDPGVFGWSEDAEDFV